MCPLHARPGARVFGGRFLLTIYYLLSTIYYLLSTIYYPLSSIYYPLSTIHYPLSTIHYLLFTLYSALQVAPLITMFFLMCYSAVNACVLVQVPVPPPPHARLLPTAATLLATYCPLVTAHYLLPTTY